MTFFPYTITKQVFHVFIHEFNRIILRYNINTILKRIHRIQESQGLICHEISPLIKPDSFFINTFWPVLCQANQALSLNYHQIINL